MSQTSLLLGWVMLCAAAEFLGIAAGAIWYGGVNVFLGEPEPIPLRLLAWLMMSFSAVPEGIILGGVQAIGLRSFVPGVSARRWIVATIIVGFLGWGIGTFIPMFIMTEEPGSGGMDGASELGSAMLFAAIFGLVIGAVFGAAQALALPRGGRRRLSWMIANAIGWAVALPMIYGAAQIASELSGWTLKIAVWAAGGCVAGALIGLTTGVALLGMKDAEDLKSTGHQRI